MNVRDLIAKLGEMDPESEVHFTYNYGDHWRTIVAPVVDKVEEGRVAHSGYHNVDAVVVEDDKGYDTADEVVLLS